MKLIQFSIFLLITLLSPYCLSADNIDTVAKSKNKNPFVVFETTMGTYTLELYPDKAPKTVANFLTYVKEGFYNNTIFHRAIPNFVVQGGGFEPEMKKKPTFAPIINESKNGLKNTRGTISMARTRTPNSATSQFFINIVHNPSLDASINSLGYAVFGKIVEGIEVIDKIIKVPTHNVNQFQDVPKKDVMIISAKTDFDFTENTNNSATAGSAKQFVAGEHYTVLNNPVPTRNENKIEVVELFAYGCPHCYEFESHISQWRKQQNTDIDFWFFPAVWNKPMMLFAKAFYTADELKVLDKIHLPLFNEVVIKQKSLRNQDDFADFFETKGVKKPPFIKTFNSAIVEQQAKKAADLVNSYKPAGVPEIIVNGKYRVDRMRSGGLKEMLEVVNFLVEKERKLQNTAMDISKNERVQ